MDWFRAALLSLTEAGKKVVTDSNFEVVDVTALYRPQPLTKSAPAR